MSRVLHGAGGGPHPSCLHPALPATVGTTVSRAHGRNPMNAIAIVGVIFGLVLLGLLLRLLLQNAQEQKKGEALESQLNELRRDLLSLSTTQAERTAKIETLAGT